MATVRAMNRVVNVEQWHVGQSKKLVMLHGFTGTAQGWEPLAQLLPNVHVIAIDLVGHGKSDVPEQADMYAMDVQLQLIHAVIQQLQLTNFSLLGYSMGGRIALSYACKYPEQIAKLLLESTSPGLDDAQARQQRIQADNALADFIEQQGLEAFVDKWENIPLFATQKLLPASIQASIRTERLSQQPLGLANSLRGIGTGKMPAVWDQLATLPMAVHLLVGEADTKFVHIALDMQKQIQHAEITQFIGCGHTIHVENLPQFATIVKESIS